MNTLEILQLAIKDQKSIEFEYNKLGKVSGKRIGDPHAIFIHPTTNNSTVDIFQTSGVSDSRQKIPGWRPFLLDYLDNIRLLDKHFKIAEGYDSNPISGKYNKLICKVK